MSVTTPGCSSHSRNALGLSGQAFHTPVPGVGVCRLTQMLPIFNSVFIYVLFRLTAGWPHVTRNFPKAWEVEPNAYSSLKEMIKIIKIRNKQTHFQRRISI